MIDQRTKARLAVREFQSALSEKIDAERDFTRAHDQLGKLLDEYQLTYGEEWTPRVRQADVWQLTPDELALYLRIAYHARPPRYLCITSTATLCDSCLSDKKVRAAKKTLQATKRIKITRRLNQTDQITIVNRVLDHRDVYVPREVVLALRPPELAVYCRIADRDRGTGCKAQNKELAINVCTVRQVANILAKLESNGLIRRYEIDGKRFISSSAYGFKAHAAHLAELEKRAADACNIGGGKEVPKNQVPEIKFSLGEPTGEPITNNSASNGTGMVPIIDLILENEELRRLYRLEHLAGDDITGSDIEEMVNLRRKLGLVTP